MTAWTTRRVSMKLTLRFAMITLMCVPAFAQWTNVRPSAIPRTPDGKPNLAAPAPRLPDGKPDLSGVWNPPAGYLRDLARDLKEAVSFQASAEKNYEERAGGLHWREEAGSKFLSQSGTKMALAAAPRRMGANFEP